MHLFRAFAFSFVLSTAQAFASLVFRVRVSAGGNPQWSLATVPNQGAKGLILVFLPDGKPGTPESSSNFPFPTVYLFLGNVFNRQGFNLTYL